MRAQPLRGWTRPLRVRNAVNAALHAAVGLRLWLQPAHDDDTVMDGDRENLQDQEFEEQGQEQERATE